MKPRLSCMLPAILALAGVLAPLPAVAVDVPDGFRVEERNGEKVYCRTRLPTGSRVRKERTCLTEAQLAELHERTKQTMDEITRRKPPPAGR